MDNKKIPDGHQTVMPYLILNGADKFLEFAKKALGARETMKHLREGATTIMHAEIAIGTSTIMFAESTDQWTAQPAGLYMYVADADEAYKKAVDAGAETVMELSDQSYGRTCGVKDPAGNTWWLTTPK